MPTMTASEATEQIIDAVERMNVDYVLAYYHEVFPEEPRPAFTPTATGEHERRKILEYLKQGLEVDDILDLWPVALRRPASLEFDEETLDFRYSDANGAFGLYS